MSRWKRLGVVISVLWLIGSPIYFHVEETLRPEREFKACMSLNPAGDYFFKSAICNLGRGKPLTIPDTWKLMTFSAGRPTATDAWPPLPPGAKLVEPEKRPQLPPGYSYVDEPEKRPPLPPGVQLPPGLEYDPPAPAPDPFITWMGVILWLMWLGPIALLWIVGGTVIGTTRWVMRGERS